MIRWFPAGVLAVALACAVGRPAVTPAARICASASSRVLPANQPPTAASTSGRCATRALLVRKRSSSSMSAWPMVSKMRRAMLSAEPEIATCLPSAQR